MFVQVSSDEYCIHEVNYTVTLRSNELIVMQNEVGSDRCMMGACFITLFPSPSNQTYMVSISATNVLGTSSSMTFMSAIGEHITIASRSD